MCETETEIGINPIWEHKHIPLKVHTFKKKVNGDGNMKTYRVTFSGWIEAETPLDALDKALEDLEKDLPDIMNQRVYEKPEEGGKILLKLEL